MFASHAPIGQRRRPILILAPGIDAFRMASDTHQLFALVFCKTDN
jgi:hypothetical protein